MQAKFAGNVVAGGNDPAFASTATDGDGHGSQARVVAHLHRGIEAVTVAVNDFAHSVLVPLTRVAGDAPELIVFLLVAETHTCQ